MNDTQKKIIVKTLDQIIKRAVPKASTVSKYGGVLYTLKPDEKEGQFCGVFCYTRHVQLAISNIPKLKDPDGVLQGTGKTRRHINFHSPDEIDSQVIIALLKQAAKS